MTGLAEATTNFVRPPVVDAAVKAILLRLKWPSMHWGTEGVHPDAWPHIAATALDAACVGPVFPVLAEQLATAPAKLLLKDTEGLYRSSDQVGIHGDLSRFLVAQAFLGRQVLVGEDGTGPCFGTAVAIVHDSKDRPSLVVVVPGYAHKARQIRLDRMTLIQEQA